MRDLAIEAVRIGMRVVQQARDENSARVTSDYESWAATDDAAAVIEQVTVTTTHGHRAF